MPSAKPPIVETAPASTPVDVETIELFTLTDLVAACLKPHRLIELLLGDRARLAQTIVASPILPLLVAVLLVAGLLFAVPFGIAPPVSAFWKVSVLYTGALLICFPSFFVFGQYVGLKLTVLQSLAIGLLISTTAGILTFGFFPIIWFVHVTSGSTETVSRPLAALLLGASLVLGVLHMLGCVAYSRQLRGGDYLLVLAWAGLVAFITLRMANFLGVVT